MLLNNPEISSHLEAKIKAIRAAFREFLDEVGPTDPWHRRHHGPNGTDQLSVALGTLRGLVGVQLGEIASIWDVEINDDLATIVPDSKGWFFERFA